MAELAGMHSLDNMAKRDMFLSFLVAEELLAAAQSIIEAPSWMDWWTFAAKSMILRFSEEVKMLKLLFVAGARCQIFVAKMASTIWANLVWKRRDDGGQGFCFSRVLHGLLQFPFIRFSGTVPWGAVEKAIEKSSHVLHDEAIQKAISAAKPAGKRAKWLHFSVLLPASGCYMSSTVDIREIRVW